MYHYVRNYSQEFPFFNFLHINDFKKQINHLNKKKKILKLSEDLDSFFNSKKVFLLTFDDGFGDHYNVFEILKKLDLKGIFFIPSYPIIKKDFLSVHKIHLILGKFKSEDVIKAIKKFNLKINLNDIKFKDKNYQIKKARNLEEKKKILIKIYLNFLIKNNNKTIVDKIFNFFFKKRYQKKLFKNFYLNKSQIKEMHRSGMIIGGHAHSHRLLGLLKQKEQEIEIKKNISCLKNILNKKVSSFAFPYGGKLSYNKATVKILKKNEIKFSFNTGDKIVKKLKNHHNINRINCNKFRFGKIYKYN